MIKAFVYIVGSVMCGIVAHTTTVVGASGPAAGAGMVLFFLALGEAVENWSKL